jgi:Protein of unknown function (DUF3300)
MTRFISRPKLQKAIAMASIALALGAGSLSLAQVPADSPSGAPIQQPPSAISPQDLANLVAPIALYPDALLAQVLAACTYPLEVVEAQQWLQQNAALPSRQLLQAAQQQPWDPSVQALVAFPGVLALLNRNISWTTDLGNAFLAEQSDVMNAIQALRAQARESGQLASTPQLSVNTTADVQGNQSAIVIQPVNPQVIYVPSYNPYVVWGAPVEGSYPALPYAGSGFGSVFSAIANLAGFLPGFQGLLGLRSWGWALSWLAQALFVNNSFFNDFGFHNSGGGYSNGGYGGSSLWVHNAHHRLGVPYGSSAVASRYGEGQGRGQRPPGDGWRTFGSGARGIAASQPRQPFTPRPSTASQRFQRDNRPLYRSDLHTERPGNQRTFSSNPRMPSPQSTRTFSPPPASRPPAMTARSLPPNRSIGRDPYLANSVDSRNRTFPGERSFSSSFSNSRSSASLHDRFANFSKAHMSSHGDSSQRSFSQHAPKQQHFSEPKFKAPKFKAPKAPKFHGEGHASRGHSGSKSHRG